MEIIDISHFHACKIVTGKVLEAELFTEARKAAIKMVVDCGEFGIKKTSAQITTHYNPSDLVGRTVITLINIPPRRIAGFESECLVLGAVPSDAGVVLLNTDQDLPSGTPIA
jgi:tRNA-binding protein